MGERAPRAKQGKTVREVEGLQTGIRSGAS